MSRSKRAQANEMKVRIVEEKVWQIKPSEVKKGQPACRIKGRRKREKKLDVLCLSDDIYHERRAIGSAWLPDGIEPRDRETFGKMRPRRASRYLSSLWL